jgi:PqqD family protein of HPr-rel-A system
MPNGSKMDRLAQKWKVRAENRLVWERWEQDAVVYDSASGETHLLNALAFEALMLLRDYPMDAFDLARRLADEFDDFDARTLEPQMQRLIDNFDELGIIVCLDT